MINAVNQFLDDLRGGKMSEAPIVTVEQGQLQGRLVSTPPAKPYYMFQGIPYAKPPLGSLRFKAPEPAEPWEGIRDATSEGNVTAQVDFMFCKQYIGDENCLFLNVATPDINATNLPVMVWIHGGGFRLGYGNSSIYGPDYLVEKDVVVVTLNYRCGVLGFLCLDTPEAPGNAGLKDCVEAIRWIKKNIHNFGGDPSNVTIFGESAGAAAVSILTASPICKDLVNKAIIESGTGFCLWAFQKNPIDSARKLASALGCESTDIGEIYEFLAATPAKDLVETHDKLTPSTDMMANLNNLFCPVIEKEIPGVESLLTESFLDRLTSGRVADIPVMIGRNALEFGMNQKTEEYDKFLPEELNLKPNTPEFNEVLEQVKKMYFKDGEDTSIGLNNLLSDRGINVDTHRYIQYLVKVITKPIYYYKFNYVGAFNIAKNMPYYVDQGLAMHFDEIPYIFKNDMQATITPSEEDLKMREKMVRLWTNFAKFGNPTPSEDPLLNVTWQPVTHETLHCLRLDKELTLISDPDKEIMEFWENLYTKYFKIWDQPAPNSIQAESPVKSDVFIVENSEPVVVETTVSTHEEPDGTIVTETVTIMTSEAKITHNTYMESVETHSIETNETTHSIESQENNTSSIVESKEEIINNDRPKIVQEIIEIQPIETETQVKNEIEKFELKNGVQETISYNNGVNQNGVDKKPRTSNEIKMVMNPNGAPKDVIRANDPPEDDLPKNIGVNKFVNFFESLGGKK